MTGGATGGEGPEPPDEPGASGEKATPAPGVHRPTLWRAIFLAVVTMSVLVLALGALLPRG